jgi:hypothetical protein
MPYSGTVLLWADGRITTSEGESSHSPVGEVRVPVLDGVDTDPNSPRYGRPVFGQALFTRTGELDAAGRCIYRQVP